MIKNEEEFTYYMSRRLLGLTLIVFAFNSYFEFLMIPMPERKGFIFIMALEKTGYMFPMISLFQLVFGLMLFFGKYVVLSTIILAPIIFNILVFHIFLAPSGITFAFLLTALELNLLWKHRAALCNLFFNE